MLWRGLVIVAAALGALVSFMPVPLSADPAAGGGIGPGSYHIAGKAPDGSTYEGDVDIWPLASAKLLYLKVAGKRYQGLALDSGPVLGVAYGIGKPFGLVVYHVDGGKLDGRWTLPGWKGEKIGRETLEGPEGLKGVYQITLGENPDGKTYKGRVEIQPDGAVYSLHWYTPAAGDSGTGILVGQELIVAYGREPGFSVLAYHREGTQIRGIWAAGYSQQTGSEELTPKVP